MSLAKTLPDSFEERVLKYSDRLLWNEFYVYKKLFDFEKDPKEKMALKYRLTVLESEYNKRKGKIV